jgi:hypothetical protein
MTFMWVPRKVSVVTLSEIRVIFHWRAYSITLTFRASLHYVCITLMTSRQNICTAVQYHIYGVAKLARVCDKHYFCRLFFAIFFTARFFRTALSKLKYKITNNNDLYRNKVLNNLFHYLSQIMLDDEFYVKINFMFLYRAAWKKMMW